MSSIPILLLAAGQSTRMRGRDKLMQTIDGVALLRRVARVAMQVGPVIAALPPPPHPRHRALDGLSLSIVPVEGASEGINASLRQALAVVPPDSPGVMILLADLPDLTEGDLNLVLQAFDPKSETLIWRGATDTGLPGHPVVFSRSLFPDLLALRGDEGAGALVRRHADRVVTVTLPGNHARTDLDSPEDWADWRRGRSEANKERDAR